MAQRLIVIAVEGPAVALDRLEARVGAAVELETSKGGLSALAAETLTAAAAVRAADVLRDAAAGRVRGGAL
jgi:hypothetical protein